MILESVMAANAAFAVIKTTVANGREIADCAKAMGAYFGHKEKIEEAANTIGGGSDLEAFYELEKLNKQEADLKYLMNKQRLGMWSDFQKFREQREQAREKAKKAVAKAKARRASSLSQTLDEVLKAFYILLTLGAVAFGSIYMLLNFKR